jgi:chemotaxis protein CheD
MTTRAEVILPVGLGELHVAGSEPAVLMALGLGSCVGVALWDAGAGVGGMAHVVLPEPFEGDAEPSPKFALHAVEALIQAVLMRGARRERLRCAIAGGADVLSGDFTKSLFNIGARNTAAVLLALRRESVQLVAQDCGGKHGRSLRLTLPEGRVAVRVLGAEWRELAG